MATNQLPRAATLRIIRLSFLAGMLLFGGMVFYLTSQNGGSAPQNAKVLQMINIVLLILAAAGILFIQRKHAAEPDPARRSTLNIAGWAMGEATAMFGGVHFMLVGNPIPYLVGVVMMIASFVLVPIRE